MEQAINISYIKLIQSAIKVMRQAYVPYSKFRVGAAIVTENDEVFTGCNVETSSYSLTICAERVALFKAISEGHRNFKAIAIVSDTGEYCPPCGACRQVLWDIAKDVEIILAKNSDDYKIEKLSKLLPHAFDDSYLHTNPQNTNDD